MKERLRLRQAAGLSYIDVYHRTGCYSQLLPFIPGLEGAETVEAIGQNVHGLKVRFESQDRPES